MKNLIVIAVFAMASFVAVAQTTPASSEKKSEKSLKGCIHSVGGQFTLEDKHGKQIALSGSPDIASHVGHTVTVHGSYPNGSPASAAFASSNSGFGSSNPFVVSKLNMVSEKCNATKFKNKDTNIDPSGKPSPNRY